MDSLSVCWIWLWNLMHVEQVVLTEFISAPLHGVYNLIPITTPNRAECYPERLLSHAKLCYAMQYFSSSYLIEL